LKYDDREAARCEVEVEFLAEIVDLLQGDRKPAKIPFGMHFVENVNKMSVERVQGKK
jgi:hypothetical protein